MSSILACVGVRTLRLGGRGKKYQEYAACLYGARHDTTSTLRWQYTMTVGPRRINIADAYKDAAVYADEYAVNLDMSVRSGQKVRKT